MQRILSKQFKNRKGERKEKEKKRQYKSKSQETQSKEKQDPHLLPLTSKGSVLPVEEEHSTKAW